MAYVGKCYIDDTYFVQCPTCLQRVTASKAVFDGLEPLPRHSQWSKSFVQDNYRLWPMVRQRKWLFRLLLRCEILIRHCNLIGEPACEDVTPRLYREWLPEGAPEGGPRDDAHSAGVRALVEQARREGRLRVVKAGETLIGVGGRGGTREHPQGEAGEVVVSEDWLPEGGPR